MSTERVVSWQEYSKHIRSSDLWVLINGLVYNVTDYVVEHPGGQYVLVQYSGTDATEKFNSVGHSSYANSLKDPRLIGRIETPNPPHGYLAALHLQKQKSKPKRKIVKRTTKITLAEIQLHKNEENCWIIYENKVYDVSGYLTDHPGGIGNIMTYAGRDATAAFKAQNHSQTALKKLYEYQIGEIESKSISPMILLLVAIILAAAGFILFQK